MYIDWYIDTYARNNVNNTAIDANVIFLVHDKELNNWPAFDGNDNDDDNTLLMHPHTDSSFVLLSLLLFNWTLFNIDILLLLLFNDNNDDDDDDNVNDLTCISFNMTHTTTTINNNLNIITTTTSTTINNNNNNNN